MQTLRSVSTTQGDVYYLGPNLEEGPCPGIFYFSLGGQESLGLEPFNQPAAALASKYRVYSYDLPFHGKDFNYKEAMQLWAKELLNSRNLIEDFIGKGQQIIDELIDREAILPNKLSVIGLSRGVFLAAHLAARDPRIENILGYAPLTSLTYLVECERHPEMEFLKSLDLTFLTPELIHKNIRLYIGNYDQRVGTDLCFNFIYNLAKFAKEKGVMSPKAELFISRSIGFKGHGTPSHVFLDGAEWLKHIIGKHDH